MANFDGTFLKEDADDQLRKNEAAYPPNYRGWRLDTEGDAKNWFLTEISNVVLAAFVHFPSVLQTSEARPLTDVSIPETVDTLYSTRLNVQSVPLVIGEMKRNLIDAKQWQEGHIVSSGQKRLSQELRGYAHKYECPQIFCFDNETLLMLQFRASRLQDIQHPECDIDCWVIPRENGAGGCTLRYAFYRLLVQGLRRFQSMRPSNCLVNGNSPTYREFYSGKPIWNINGNYHSELPGYSRAIDPHYGAFYWKYGENEYLNGNERLWDTGPLWNF